MAKAAAFLPLEILSPRCAIQYGNCYSGPLEGSVVYWNSGEGEGNFEPVSQSTPPPPTHKLFQSAPNTPQDVRNHYRGVLGNRVQSPLQSCS